jgi:hypothetical protein
MSARSAHTGDSQHLRLKYETASASLLATMIQSGQKPIPQTSRCQREKLLAANFWVPVAQKGLRATFFFL